MEDRRGIVRHFILEQFLPGEDAANLTDSTELKESGILDSLSTLRLVAFLEERFGVELEAGDLGAQSLSSVENIDRLLQKKTGGAGQ